MKIELRPKSLIHERIAKKKKPIDQLIALALSGDNEEAIAQKAQNILEEIRETRLRTELTIQQQLADLEVVARLPQLHDTQELQEAVTDTAEYLCEEMKADQKIKSKIGLPATLAALRTWDELRTPETEVLCEATLDNFKGSAQPVLNKAFVMARERSIPYEDAHELAIEEMAA
ncbi:MAG TPA: hypothetical protein VGE13_03140 [Candidatus Saccharimonadales bacterium]